MSKPSIHLVKLPNTIELRLFTRPDCPKCGHAMFIDTEWLCCINSYCEIAQVRYALPRIPLQELDWQEPPPPIG